MKQLLEELFDSMIAKFPNAPLENLKTVLVEELIASMNDTTTPIDELTDNVMKRIGQRLSS